MKTHNNDNNFGELLLEEAVISESDIPNREDERKRILSEIREAYETGLKYYANNKYEQAEQEFANVLRPVLSKSDRKNIYINIDDCNKKELLNAMYHLGLIYQENDQYFNNYAKAAGIFQYCAGFAKKYDIEQFEINGKQIDFLNEAHLVQEKFLKSLGKINIDQDLTIEQQLINYRKEIDKYIDSLAQIRKETGERVTAIRDWPIEKIAERARVVEEIYNHCSNFFVNNDDKEQNPGLVQRIIAKCFEQLGAPPEKCEYSFIGFGSLAGGRMTPWSDLEFAILINEDKEEYKEYFRNLTKLLHIKVVNLGETPLRSLAVEALNNFRTTNPGDEWFYDEVLKSGFSFDGPDWHACKLPLGRQGGYKVKSKIKNEDGTETEIVINKLDFELILTPRQLAEFQLDQKEVILNDNSTTLQESWYKSDVHLVQSMRLVSLIDGSQNLLDDYRGQLHSIEKQEIVQSRIVDTLKEDIESFSLKLGDEEEGKLIDVKKNIFRIGDRIIDDLANYYGITAEKGQSGLTAWQAIDKMQKAEILSLEGAQHLKEALSISTELRLTTYCHNRGQNETMSTYQPAVEHLSETERKKLIEETFFIKDTNILHHFYYIMTTVQDVFKEFNNINFRNKIENYLKENNLITINMYIKGMVHARFLEYRQALECMESIKEEGFKKQRLEFLDNLLTLYTNTGKTCEAIEVAHRMTLINNNDILSLYIHLGGLYTKICLFDEAIIYLKKAKNLSRDSDKSKFLGVLNNLGALYVKLGLYDKAIKYFKQGLTIKQETSSDDNSISFSNIGLTYLHQGHYKKAIKYLKKDLEVYKQIYNNIPNHPTISNIYINLASYYQYLNQHTEMGKYYKTALLMRKKIYSSIPNHPLLLLSYNNMAKTFLLSNNYEKAIKYYHKALQLERVSELKNTYNNDIADIFNDLSIIYRRLGQFDKAKSFIDKAIQIKQKIFSTHNDKNYEKGICYSNLGNYYFSQGDYENAKINYLKELEIIKTYAKTYHHSGIIANLESLGHIYRIDGLFDKAIENYSEALARKYKLYGKDSKHFTIGESYNNLGNIYLLQSHYEKAIDCYKVFLENKEIIHKGNLLHPDIAMAYNSLGLVYCAKGEHDEAIEYYNQSLAIRQKAYEHSPNHPDIAASYYNLGIVHLKQGSFHLSFHYSEKALEVYKVIQNQNSLNIYQILRNLNLLQLGNLALLENNIAKAQQFYKLVDNAYECINFFSIELIQLQLEQISTLYELNAVQAVINCQKVLIKLDPELKYGNHYHNLACYLAANDNIKEANETFLLGFNHPNANKTSSLFVEYAQFLIINKDNNDLNIDAQQISSLLYQAIISDNNSSSLSYGKLEKNSVCAIIKNLIEQRDETIEIEVKPKILAYYLLITNPGYIAENDNIENLLRAFTGYCEYIQDEISYKLLADAYATSGDDELAIKHMEYAESISKVNSIIDGKIELENNKEILNFARAEEHTDKLAVLALKAASEQNIEESLRYFTKVFQIYSKVLIDNPQQLQLAADSLAFLSLLTDDIDQYIFLKFNYNTELNQQLVNLFKLSDISIEQFQVIESETLLQVQLMMQQQEEQNAVDIEDSQNEQSLFSETIEPSRDSEQIPPSGAHDEES